MYTDDALSAHRALRVRRIENLLSAIQANTCVEAGEYHTGDFALLRHERQANSTRWAFPLSRHFVGLNNLVCADICDLVLWCNWNRLTYFQVCTICVSLEEHVKSSRVFNRSRWNHFLGYCVDPFIWPVNYINISTILMTHWTRLEISSSIPKR